MAANQPPNELPDDVLKKRQLAIQDAAKRERNPPNDFKSRQECVNAHMALPAIATGRVIYDIGLPYPPSAAEIKDLKRIMIKDLKLETHNRGFYLILRFICAAKRTDAVLNVAEDGDGTVMNISVHKQEPEGVRSAESILKRNSVIILKESYFKVGRYILRVDHPTNIFWLSEDDDRIPMDWRSADADDFDSAEIWNKKAVVFRSKKDFFNAIDM